MDEAQQQQQQQQVAEQAAAAAAAAASPAEKASITQPKPAIAFQSPKYLQQPGALHHIGEYVTSTFPTARKAGIITSRRLRARYLADLSTSITDMVVVEFSGECSQSWLEKIASQLAGQGIDYVVGFGGGKLLDLAKLVADRLRVPMVMVPSLASTDAPCIALSVVYTDAGEFEAYVPVPRSPDLVIVDSKVIAEAPVEYLVSGMGDALSTFYEARACIRNPTATTRIQPLTFRPPRIANAICAECLSILYQHGPAAKADCAAGLVTDALEQVIEANTLLSGLGVECGGLSVAHGLHNALTLLPETHTKMHGEKVAFGTQVQLMLEGDVAEAVKVARFNKLVGLPTCLQDLGVVMDEAKLELLVGSCLSPDSTCWTVGSHLTADMLKSAILAADELGSSM